MSKTLNVITGPSGGGKSVFCNHQSDWEHCLYNLDNFARQFGDVNDYANRERAWGALIAAARERMRSGAPMLCVDCVLGQAEFSQVLDAGREHGYELHLWVIAPASAEICEQRIRQRLREGGHGRPEMARELYESSLSAAAEFSVECDHTLLFDSTETITLVAHIERFELTALADPPPRWVRDYFPPPVQRTTV